MRDMRIANSLARATRLAVLLQANNCRTHRLDGQNTRSWGSFVRAPVRVDFDPSQDRASFGRSGFKGPCFVETIGNGSKLSRDVFVTHCREDASSREPSMMSAKCIQSRFEVCDVEVLCERSTKSRQSRRTDEGPAHRGGSCVIAVEGFGRLLEGEGDAACGYSRSYTSMRRVPKPREITCGTLDIWRNIPFRQAQSRTARSSEQSLDIQLIGRSAR